MDPLRHQLAQIGDNIKEHKEIIDASRASILQNDQKIYKLLTEM
jgi:Microtubule-binding protein MIP-T3 C-terminal region